MQATNQSTKQRNEAANLDKLIVRAADHESPHFWENAKIQNPVQNNALFLKFNCSWCVVIWTGLNKIPDHYGLK